MELTTTQIRQLMEASEHLKELLAENDRLKKTIKDIQKEWTDDKKPKACEHCKYYIKHYIKNDLMFMEINAGHCTRGRSTKRRKHDDSCKFFELGRYEMR